MSIDIKHSLAFKANDKLPVRLIGSLLDQCHEAFMQFVDFLVRHLTRSFIFSTPLFSMHLQRRSTRSKCRTWASYAGASICSPTQHFCCAAQSSSTRSASWPASLPRAYVDEIVIVSTHTRQKSANDLFIEASNAVMAETCAQVAPFYPSSVWSNVSPTLFTLFWSLSLYDLYVPTQSYATTIARLRKDKV